jgi:hypothetical protein
MLALRSEESRGDPRVVSFRAFRKGVFVKRCVVCILFLVSVLFLALPVHADESVSLVGSTTSPANDFAGQIIANGISGRVGIGTKLPAATLEVYQGEIKLGSTGAACTKELIGAIRFADDRLWVCNSRGWRALATDGPPK